MNAENSQHSLLWSLCGDQDKASSRVRGFWVAEALVPLNVKSTLGWDQSKTGLCRVAFAIRHHDAVIFQKTYSRYHRWLMAFARKLGKPSYLDLDDAPSRVHSPTTLKNVESMIRMADGVFVGNRNLYNYAKKHQENVYLVPSGINLKHYRVFNQPKRPGRLCLGWIGNGAHYQQDLIEVLVPPLTKLAKRHPSKLKLIGTRGAHAVHAAFKTIPGLEVEFIHSVDWSDPGAIAEAMREFDVGLFPLLPSDFNQFKCGFKALEYMATGIPVVASPVAINAEIVESGKDGFLASSEDDWVQALSQLIESRNLRVEMGKMGRKKVETTFDVTKIAEQIDSILKHDHRRCSPSRRPSRKEEGKNE